MTVTDSINAVNSSVRTVLALVFAGVLGYGGWQAYTVYDAERIAADKANKELETARVELEQSIAQLSSAKADIAKKSLELEQQSEEIKVLNADIEVKAAEIDRLDTAMRLLKVDHRVARLTVLDQVPDDADGPVTTLVEFQELTPQGDPAGEPRRFEVDGDIIYIDNWVVKFDDEFVENADIDRSTSLVLFRRIFGEYQEPRHGHMLDQVGAQPFIYSRGGKPSEFETKIWKDFWMIANDEDRAQEMGIRAAHGEAVSIKVKKGKKYRVSLRASDGLSIQPEN